MAKYLGTRTFSYSAGEMRLSIYLNYLLTLVLALTMLSETARGSTAEFDESVRLFQKQDYEGSRTILKELVKKAPAKGLYWFNLGNSQFMLGSFRDAEASFRKVEKLKSPLSPAARLYRAKVLREQRRLSEARILLTNLVNDSMLKANLKASASDELASIQDDEDNHLKRQALADYSGEQAHAALKKISAIRNPDADAIFLKGLILAKLNRTAEAEVLFSRMPAAADDEDRQELLRLVIGRLKDEPPPGHTFWMYLDGALGYNSNVYYDPQDMDPRAATTARFSSALGGRYWSRDSLQGSAFYRLDWHETANSGDLKIINHFAQTSLTFESNGDFLLLGLFASHENWANQASLMKNGLRGRAKRSWENSAAGVDLDFVINSPLRNEISFLGGNDIVLRIFYDTNWPNSLKSQVFLEAEQNLIGDQTFSDGSILPWRFQSWAPGARLTWRWSSDWSLNAQGMYKMRSYPTASMPNGTERQDRELNLGLHLNRILGPRLSSYLSSTLVKNASTLGSSSVKDENYSLFATHIGIVYDFF